MKLDDYHYHLPPELIAQEPHPTRDGSRLLHLPLSGDTLDHHRFDSLPALLNGDEVVVFNNTRVIPARLMGRRPSGGRVEILLMDPAVVTPPHTPVAPPSRSKPLLPGDAASPLSQQLPCCPWRCLVRPARKLTPGTDIILGEHRFPVLDNLGNGEIILDLSSVPENDLERFLASAGQVPLPPYIRRSPVSADQDRYQTVFAQVPGAVAAPTAGLHFTHPLLERLQHKGCTLAQVTLHVGPGTFLPIRTDNPEDHRMHAERYEVPKHTAQVLNDAMRDGRPILAVGTTVVRTLEAAALASSGHHHQPLISPGAGSTDLFIYPGFSFQVVHGLLTNFHLPQSTLLMLVSALTGRERLMEAYQEAVKQRYRFFSYGDAMLIS